MVHRRIRRRAAYEGSGGGGGFGDFVGELVEVSEEMIPVGGGGGGISGGCIGGGGGVGGDGRSGGIPRRVAAFVIHYQQGKNLCV